MKDFIKTVTNSLKCYFRYHFVYIIILLSVIFSFFMGMTQTFSPLIYIYISIFILPVVTFSIALFIEAQQKKLLPDIITEKHTAIFYTAGKIVAALILQLIPMFLYIIVLNFALSYQFNYFLFILVYLLASLIHIIIGLSLSIIAKSTFGLSFSYLVYLVFFSLMPIFYIYGYIPIQLGYALIISPAYMSGLLFDDIIYGINLLPLTIISVLLQIVYIIVLTFFVIHPFIKDYLLKNYIISEKTKII